MSFRSVFIAIVIAFALILSGYLINRSRPTYETDYAKATFIRATGQCADCHRQRHYSVVHEYEMSVHAQKGVSCLDCHQPMDAQEKLVHHGFVISKHLTASNCRNCHDREYRQFLQSRHAAASWAAVFGESGLSKEQVDFAEQFHPGSCKRPANPLVKLEGQEAITSGCIKCHSVGKPNSDGSIGTCTSCHTRHVASVAVARLPTTCGQCHMGPDHSQLEIYHESKHGVIFAAQKDLLNLSKDPVQLTSKDMFVPTCATCHMSGLNGLKSSHDTSERLSYKLADPISSKRPNYTLAQSNMKEVCSQCHANSLVDRIYLEAEKTVQSVNEKVKESLDIMDGLHRDKILGTAPLSQPIDFKYFDLWHYYGRTAKHGAFMGGQDFAHWHGTYPLLKLGVELKTEADKLRKEHDAPKKQ